MMGGCMECKKWEEEMYWSRFQTLHFCQFLSGRFYQQIAIPEKFANNLREKIGETVALKGPSGHVWDVGLATTNGDTLVFKNGWKEFVRDHSLQENDFLIFKYSRNSGFDVLMFDQGSLCEKTSSYFVKKCKHAETGCGSGQRKRTERVVIDSEESADIDVDDGPLLKRPRTEARKTPPTRTQPLRFSGRGRRGGRSGGLGSSSRTTAHFYQLKSRRRVVSSEEIEKAKQRANAEPSDTNFIVVMRASHVYNGFFMTIPAEWAKKHLPESNREVELRTNGNTWKAKYQYRGHSSGLTGGGWKKFVRENFLEEFDVCVFDLVAGVEDATTGIQDGTAGTQDTTTGIQDTIALQVKIFRVVEEVIPHLVIWRRASSGSNRRRRVTSFALDFSEEEEEDDEDE